MSTKDVQNIVGWSFQTQVDTIKLWLPDYFKLFNRAQVQGVLDKLKIVWQPQFYGIHRCLEWMKKILDLKIIMDSKTI